MSDFSIAVSYRLNWSSLPSRSDVAPFVVALAREAHRVAMQSWGAPGPHFEDGAYDLYTAARLFAEAGREMLGAGVDADLARSILGDLHEKMVVVTRVARALESGMIDYGRAGVEAARRDALTVWEQYVVALRSTLAEAADYVHKYVVPNLATAAGYGLAVVVGVFGLLLLLRR